MRNLRGLAGTLLLAALLVPPTYAERDASFRGFWVDAFHIGFKSTAQINVTVSRAIEGNYNAIVAEVLAYHDTGTSAHGAYWDSAIVPMASDISGGIDPLAELVSVAHANGIEVHAWIVPYRACTSWPPSGNTTLSAHPEWVMVPMANMDSGPCDVDNKYFLDPGSPGVQDYLIDIVEELVTNYAIDGVNYDYIRYTQQDLGYPSDAGYDESSLARFQNLTGYVGTPDPEDESSWNDFRRQTIDEFVRRSRAAIASIDSNPQQPVRFTADLITFGDAPSNFTSTSAYQLHQNWRYWLEQGWLDAGIPMDYKREYNSSEATWYRNWIIRSVNYWSGDRHIFGGQGNYLNTKADSVTQLQYCLNAGTEGTCNYSYAYTADENMNGTPESDWTWYSYVSTNLFTSAVATPTMPWRDPATATEGTLWGRVTDWTTSGPIDGAEVQAGGLTPVYTDGNGYYVITLIPAGSGGSSYTLTAESDSCAPASISGVVVTPGEVARRDIVLCDPGPGVGDIDQDGDIDMTDFELFVYCMQGPDYVYGSPSHMCRRSDADGDADDDLVDFAGFQLNFGIVP